jgi:hypothetical protein
VPIDRLDVWEHPLDGGKQGIAQGTSLAIDGGQDRGTSSAAAVLARAVTLLVRCSGDMDWMGKATQGWWSIRHSTELSRVSSLRFKAEAPPGER